VVLEAQDYVGGRMKTELLDDDDERPLEYGANWIHGLWVSSDIKKIKKILTR